MRYAFIALVLLALSPHSVRAESLNVVVSVPELGALVKEIAAPDVSVAILAKPSEDPHLVQAKPSFLKLLADADLLVVVGLDLEIGWIPPLIDGCRNPRLRPGAIGYLDASSAIRPLEVSHVKVDRSHGDVHPGGNPHYLLEPISGLLVARMIKDRLTQLEPGQAEVFAERYRSFQSRLGAALFGEKLVSKYDPLKLAELDDLGHLEAFLRDQGELALLGGWYKLATQQPRLRVIADHNVWPYFAQRFKLEVAGFLEPKPGISPSSSHIEALISSVRSTGVVAYLRTPYFETRQSDLVISHTGIRLVQMSHQLGAARSAGDYLSFIDGNVRAVFDPER